MILELAECADSELLIYLPSTLPVTLAIVPVSFLTVLPQVVLSTYRARVYELHLFQEPTLSFRKVDLNHTLELHLLKPLYFDDHES